MTADELRVLYPRASESFIQLNADGGTTAVSHSPDQDHSAGEPAVVERPAGDPIEKADEPKEGYSTRYKVVVHNYRRRLLDEDNLCPKFHIDALRYSGLLPTDAPGSCKISVGQSKVATRDEERVEIQIWPPGTWIEIKEGLNWEI